MYHCLYFMEVREEKKHLFLNCLGEIKMQLYKHFALSILAMTARLRKKLQIDHASINIEFKADNQGKFNCLMKKTTALMTSSGH